MSVEPNGENSMLTTVTSNPGNLNNFDKKIRNQENTLKFNFCMYTEASSHGNKYDQIMGGILKAPPANPRVYII